MEIYSTTTKSNPIKIHLSVQKRRVLVTKNKNYYKAKGKRIGIWTGGIYASIMILLCLLHLNWFLMVPLTHLDVITGIVFWITVRFSANDFFGLIAVVIGYSFGFLYHIYLSRFFGVVFWKYPKKKKRIFVTIGLYLGQYIILGVFWLMSMAFAFANMGP